MPTRISAYWVNRAASCATESEMPGVLLVSLSTPLRANRERSHPTRMQSSASTTCQAVTPDGNSASRLTIAGPSGSDYWSGC